MLARWRVLQKVPAEIGEEVPNTEQVRQLLDAPAESYRSVYAAVAGELPLADVATKKAGPVFLMGEFQVAVPGQVELLVQAPEKTEVWLDAIPSSVAAKSLADVSAGRHKIFLRVVAGPESTGALKVELRRPAGSNAQFDPVGGP